MEEGRSGGRSVVRRLIKEVQTARQATSFAFVVWGSSKVCTAMSGRMGGTGDEHLQRKREKKRCICVEKEGKSSSSGSLEEARGEEGGFGGFWLPSKYE